MFNQCCSVKVAHQFVQHLSLCGRWIGAVAFLNRFGLCYEQQKTLTAPRTPFCTMSKLYYYFYDKRNLFQA